MKPAARVRRRHRSKSPISVFAGYGYDQNGNSASNSDHNSVATTATPSPRSMTCRDIGSESTESSDASAPVRVCPVQSTPNKTAAMPLDVAAVPPEETAIPTPRWVSGSLTPPPSYRYGSERACKQFLYEKPKQGNESEDAISHPPDSATEGQAVMSWVVPRSPRSATPGKSRAKSPGPDARQVEAALQDAENARARAMRAIGYRKDGEIIRMKIDAQSRIPCHESHGIFVNPPLSTSLRNPQRSVSPRFGASPENDDNGPARQSFERMQQTMPASMIAQTVSQQRSGSFSPEPRVLPMPNENQTPLGSPRFNAILKASREDATPLKARQLRKEPNAFDSFDVWRAQLRKSAGIGLRAEVTMDALLQGDSYDSWRERLIRLDQY